MGKLLHWKEGARTPGLNPIVYKCKTPSFTPRNIALEQGEKGETIKSFASARLKLQSILRRHEKIESILIDVKQRVAPMQFLLSTADEKNTLLNHCERMKNKFESATDRWRLCAVSTPHSELKTSPRVHPTLRSQLRDLKSMDLLGEESFAQEAKSVQQQQQQQQQLSLKPDEESENVVAMAKDDWKKMLKDLNEWCMQMDSAEESHATESVSNKSNGDC
ncbi:hypothetical protein KR222_004410 [Zaprionus bogoriensis]|nr:hypothetical protein KR222_004410 [Zaprionus bogoriensis]